MEFRIFTPGGAIRIPQTIMLAGGDIQSWIYDSVESTNNIMRIWNREKTNTPAIAFGCDIDAHILLVYETHVESRREIRCNTHNSIGNVDVVFKDRAVSILSFKHLTLRSIKEFYEWYSYIKHSQHFI